MTEWLKVRDVLGYPLYNLLYDGLFFYKKGIIIFSIPLLYGGVFKINECPNVFYILCSMIKE